jgi:hypothetical protein
VHEVFFSYFLHHTNQTAQQQEIVAFLQRELQAWSQCHQENSMNSNSARNPFEKADEAAEINSQYVHGYLVDELINLYDNDIPLLPHHHQFTDLLQLFIQLLDGRDGVCLDLETALVVIKALQTQYFPHINQQPKPLTLQQIHIKPPQVSPTPTLSDQSDAGLSPLAVPTLALHRVSPTNTLKQSEIERTTPLRLFTPVAAHNVCPPDESSLKTHSEPSPVRQVTLSRTPHHLTTTACSLAKQREKYTPPQREPFRQCQWS